MQTTDDLDPSRGILVALGLSVALAAAAVAACQYTGISLFDHAKDAEVTAALVNEACIAQYGPSERWLRHAHVYECVTAAMEPPSYVLSSPLGQR